MNAIQQYEDYLSWLTVKYREVAVERALFWQSARPYRIDWDLARKYGELIRFISVEMDATRAALEIERDRLRRESRFAVARAYLRRVTAFLAGQWSPRRS